MPPRTSTAERFVRLMEAVHAWVAGEFRGHYPSKIIIELDGNRKTRIHLPVPALANLPRVPPPSAPPAGRRSAQQQQPRPPEEPPTPAPE
jgi:hypothetical protein